MFSNDDESIQLALKSLVQYISSNNNSILLAGPPTLTGTLAEFYKNNPSHSACIKGFEFENCKSGIHSLVRYYSSELKIVGKKHEKTIILSRSSGTQQMFSSSAIKAAQKQQQKEQQKKTLDELKGSLRGIRILLDELSSQIDLLRLE